MISNIESNYNLIYKLFEFKKSSEANKQKLIEMAKNGEDKPNSRRTKLGRALREYTRKSSNCFDSTFNKSIVDLRPDWFISRSQIAKQKLIVMAKSGKNRPTQKKRIGRALSYFTIKSSPSYDPDFDKIIRELAPHWFFSQSQTANLTKQKLIEMAKNKEDRPHWKTKLAYALGNYTLKSSPAYDPDFDKIIRELAPHWFKK